MLIKKKEVFFDSNKDNGPLVPSLPTLSCSFWQVKGMVLVNPLDPGDHNLRSLFFSIHLTGLSPRGHMGCVF